MDTNRLKKHQQARLRVAADRAHQIFRLAHRHGLSAKAAAEIYERAKGNWSVAGELAKGSSADHAGEDLTQDRRSDL